MENENIVGNVDNSQYICEICEDSFNILSDLIDHQLIHENSKLQKPKCKRKKLNLTNAYCDICCRNYASEASLKCHYNRAHLEEHKEEISKIYEEDDRFYKSKTKNVNFLQNSDVFIEFENNLPLEFSYDQYICSMCDYVSVNLNQHEEHENTHYQSNANINYLASTSRDNSSIENIQNDSPNTHDIPNDKNENSNINTNYQTNVNEDYYTTTSKDSIGSDNKQNENASCANENMSMNEDVHEAQQEPMNFNDVMIKINDNITFERISEADIIIIGDDDDTPQQAINCESSNVDLSKANDVINVVKKLDVPKKDQVNKQQSILNNCAPSTSKDNSKECEKHKAIKPKKYPNLIDDEEYMKVFNDFTLEVVPFPCQFCNKICEIPEHFEVYSWLNCP